MWIDNKIFLVPGVPITILLITRVMWALAGAPWTEGVASVAAMACTLGGLLASVFIWAALEDGGISIGGFWLWRKK